MYITWFSTMTQDRGVVADDIRSQLCAGHGVEESQGQVPPATFLTGADGRAVADDLG